MINDIESVIGSNVSRETMERLQLYVALLEKWSPKINLVSKTTLADAWDRHVIDSAQLFSNISAEPTTILDVGSGAGFPGLVLAILCSEMHPTHHVILVESDQRKCAFLRNVTRETDVSVDVVANRIETISVAPVDIVTARAFMPLPGLLGVMKQHAKSTGKGLFMKGRTWRSEIAAAEQKWRFRYESHPSITDENAVTLEIRELSYA